MVFLPFWIWFSAREMRAMPKSIIRSWPLSSSMMFCGLMSRWTTPLRWAWSRARRIWAMKWTVSRLVILPPRSLRYSRRVIPSTHSITIYCKFSLTETS